MAAPITTYTKALGDEILRRIARGEMLSNICEEQGMPSRATVYTWRSENAAFAELYAKSREHQAEAIFDDMLEIADDSRNDWIEKRNKDGSTYQAFDSEHVQRSSLRIKTRQWMLPRLNKRMADKTQLDHITSDGSMASMSDEVKAARLTAIHEAAMKKLASKQQTETVGFVGDDGSDLC